MSDELISMTDVAVYGGFALMGYSTGGFFRAGLALVVTGLMVALMAAVDSE